MKLFAKLFVRGLIAVAFCFVGPVLATGVSPYTTVKLSPALELEIERLVVLAGIPNLTKPYSLATIFQHLDTIRYTHPALYSRLSLALKRYERKFSLTHARLAGNYSDAETVAWANHRGNRVNTVGELSLRSQWQVFDQFGIYGGVYVTNYRDGGLPDEFQVDHGSHVALGVSWAQLDIGYRDFWLSPLQGSAQLLSTHGETMPSLTLSNNLPIEFLDVRWQYQLFLAQMQNQPVLYQGEYTVGDKPLLAGLHIGMQPTPWWSLGATRLFQFSGGERPRDLGTLIDAFIDPRGTDNDADLDEQSGNQIAALTSRINFDGALPFSFVAELAGEDTNNNKDYQLGNTAVSAGFFFPYFFSERLSLSLEYTDWQTAWYRNGVYREGFTNDGYIAGNWAMQAQADMWQSVLSAGENLPDAQGGTSYYLGAHYQLPNDHLLYLQLRQAKHDNVPALQKSWEAELDYTVSWGSHMISFGVHAGEDNFGEAFSRVNLALEW